MSNNLEPPQQSPSLLSQPAGQQSTVPSVIPDQITPVPLTTKPRRKLWIPLSIMLGLLLVAGGILLYFTVFQVQNPASATLNTFCKALQSGDYQKASSQLSVPSVQGLNEESLR